MTRYHINPNTGNPNVCPGKAKCKFASEEGVIPPHYETKTEAKEAIEAQRIAAINVELIAVERAVANAVESHEEELRGSENLEKAIKIARKLSITLTRNRPIYRARLLGIRDNAFRFIRLNPRRNR